jgi:RNA ligase
MNYEFPTINNISDVLPAIEGRDEFVVAEKEGYTVINYNVMMADTFPDVLASDDLRANHDHYEVENLHARLRRECRGIIFDTATGEILRRPFHKFFNVNERDETQDHVVDMSRPHAILEKLDGSMIAPFIVNGEMIWGTKMGATDVAKPVQEFVARNPEYITFADESIGNGWTPIFEWCSRKQRIVLDYFHDQLVLTGLRNMKTGAYALHANLEVIGQAYAIPVVNEFAPHTDMKAFLEYVRDLEDVEGFVVRFSDGHMLKLKCDWYVQIHKAKEKILQDRNIVELILDCKLDDVMAHLPAEDRDRLIVFEAHFNSAYADVVYMLANDLDWIREENIDRKTFALEHAKTYRDPYIPTLIFKNFDVMDHVEYWNSVDDTIRKNLTKTVKYEALRDAWFPGVKYNA